MKKIITIMFITLISILFVSCKKDNTIYVDLYINNLPDSIEVTGGEKTVARLHMNTMSCCNYIYIGDYELFDKNNHALGIGNTYSVELKDIKKGETKIYDINVYSFLLDLKKGLNAYDILQPKICYYYEGFFTGVTMISMQLYNTFNGYISISCDDSDITVRNPKTNDNVFYLKHDEPQNIYIHNKGSYKEKIRLNFIPCPEDEILFDNYEIRLTENRYRYLKCKETGWYKIEANEEYRLHTASTQFQSIYDPINDCSYFYIDYGTHENSSNSGDVSYITKDRYILLESFNEVVKIKITKIEDERLLPYDKYQKSYDIGEVIKGYFYPGMKMIIKYSLPFEYEYEFITSDNIKYKKINYSDSFDWSYDHVFLVEMIDPIEEGEFTFQLVEK